MLSFLDIVLLLAVAGILALAVRGYRKGRKNGGCSCGSGGCAGCTGCGSGQTECAACRRKQEEKG